MSSKKVIAVFGATGSQGGSVAKIFLADHKLKNDWTVRAITRDATKESAQKLKSQGAEVISADTNDKSSLVNALKAADTVYAVTNYWEKMDMDLEIKQGKNIADAAKEAGVQHFIWSSLPNVTKLSNGKLAKVFHFDSKAKVEEYAREIGIPSTFFLPGFYMSNIPGRVMRQSPPNNAWTFGLPIPANSPMPLFDTVSDTGKFVKAIVLNRDRILGRRVLGASAYVTPTEIIEDFKKAYPEAGKDVVFYQIPHDQYLKALTGSGMPDFAAEELLQNMRVMNEFGYYGNEKLEDSLALLEDKPVTWAEFIKTAPAFKDLK